MGRNNYLIRKTQMKEAINKLLEENSTCVEKIELCYKELLDENNLLDKMLAKHLRKSILPSIAVYKMLINCGMEKEKAYEIVRESVLNDAKKSQKIFRIIGKLPFGYYLMKFMTPIVTKKIFGESGWQFDWKRIDKRAVEFDCHKCFYFDVFQKYLVPELTPIFCESDDVVYGSIPNITWARTKTIGKGDEVCDFKFINEKRKK